MRQPGSGVCLGARRAVYLIGSTGNSRGHYSSGNCRLEVVPVGQTPTPKQHDALGASLRAARDGKTPLEYRSPLTEAYQSLA